jgi:hypothetical protein
MEVVTLAKLWGRVGDTPHLSPPSPEVARLRTCGVSLYICTTWGETSVPVSLGATKAVTPFSISLVITVNVSELGPLLASTGCESLQATRYQGWSKPCTLLWGLKS